METRRSDSGHGLPSQWVSATAAALQIAVYLLHRHLSVAMGQKRASWQFVTIAPLAHKTDRMRPLAAEQVPLLDSVKFLG
jgi:hypothetical protein